MWLVSGLVVLASSPPLYGKVPRLILKETNRLTQALVFSRSYFLRCVVVKLFVSRAWRLIIHTCKTGMFSNTLYAQHPVSPRIFLSLPGYRLRFFIAMKSRYSYEHTLCSSINRLYEQNPVFEIVDQESVKVYLHMYNGNIQQNPLCAASCVPKDIPISFRLSPTIFYRRENSALYSRQFLIYSRLNRCTLQIRTSRTSQ